MSSMVTVLRPYGCDIKDHISEKCNIEDYMKLHPNHTYPFSIKLDIIAFLFFIDIVSIFIIYTYLMHIIYIFFSNMCSITKLQLYSIINYIHFLDTLNQT